MTFFPYAVGLLEFGAGVVYMVNGRWALAITWFAYSVAAVALASAK